MRTPRRIASALVDDSSGCAAQKPGPGLCAVKPDMPPQHAEMAWLLARGNAAFEAWLDPRRHPATATDDADRRLARCLP